MHADTSTVASNSSLSVLSEWAWLGGPHVLQCTCVVCCYRTINSQQSFMNAFMALVQCVPGAQEFDWSAKHQDLIRAIANFSVELSNCPDANKPNTMCLNVHAGMLWLMLLGSTGTMCVVPSSTSSRLRNCSSSSKSSFEASAWLPVPFDALRLRLTCQHYRLQPQLSVKSAR